jgi:Uma2 family endonuclease
VPIAMLPRSTDLPPPDERLVMPESGFEIVGGEVIAVSPAHEPHGNQHSKLSALLEAHCGEGYNCAVDMLTRTAWREDFAPDASIYAIARDPATGGRMLEELAFEIVVTESLAHAGDKAAKLVRRGVRRVFAIDVERGRALEWSREVDGWQILGPESEIVDVALDPALAVRDLVFAGKSDDAVARALLAKRNAVLQSALDARHAEGHAEGLAEGDARGRAASIVAVLVARGLSPTPDERGRILAMRDAAVLDRWLSAVASCTGVADLLGEPR